MHPYLRWTATALLLFAVAPRAEAQTPLGFEPQHGMLVLVGGQVLEGKVTRAGDHYFVTLPGGEIKLKATEVELFCRDLEEGYQRKSEAVIAGQVEDHLKLAEWCIRVQLYGYAARELSASMACEPTHPKIALLERRLEVARSQVEDKPNNEPVPVPVSNEDLDRMVRSMPPGTVEMFAHTIQPLLVNQCSTGGCHGPGMSSHLSLQRIAMGKTPSRRLTQRNLHATLRFINSEDPALSPLLINSVRAHGDSKAPVFTTGDMVQYRQLVNWVFRVAQKNVASGSETLPTRSAPLAQAPLPRVSAKPAAEASPASLGNASDPLGIGKSPAPQQAAGAPTPLPSAPATTADPFDPEVFNRQFAPPSQVPAQPEAPTAPK